MRRISSTASGIAAYANERPRRRQAKDSQFGNVTNWNTWSTRLGCKTRAGASGRGARLCSGKSAAEKQNRRSSASTDAYHNHRTAVRRRKPGPDYLRFLPFDFLAAFLAAFFFGAAFFFAGFAALFFAAVGRGAAGRGEGRGAAGAGARVAGVPARPSLMSTSY